MALLYITLLLSYISSLFFFSPLTTLLLNSTYHLSLCHLTFPYTVPLLYYYPLYPLPLPVLPDRAKDMAS